MYLLSRAYFLMVIIASHREGLLPIEKKSYNNIRSRERNHTEEEDEEVEERPTRSLSTF